MFTTSFSRYVLIPFKVSFENVDKNLVFLKIVKFIFLKSRCTPLIVLFNGKYVCSRNAQSQQIYRWSIPLFIKLLLKKKWFKAVNSLLSIVFDDFYYRQSKFIQYASKLCISNGFLRYLLPYQTVIATFVVGFDTWVPFSKWLIQISQAF